MSSSSSLPGTSIDALYEQVRKAAPVTSGEVPTELAPVAPGIRVLALRTPTLPPAAHTNTYVVGPEGGPQLVVDPGSPYGDQQEVLDRAIDGQVVMVLLTHHHGDHVGGAAAFAARWNVPIAAHVATTRRLGGRVKIDRELADEEVVESGVRCVWTPGHAEGHLCFELGDAIVAGDMVAGIGTILIDPSEGDMATYLDSLNRMLSRAPRILLPAHGPAITDAPGKLREYIAHRLMREGRVVAALAAHPGATLDELVRDAYADTPSFLWPLAARSLRAHLDKLLREGRARVDGDRWSA